MRIGGPQSYFFGEANPEVVVGVTSAIERMERLGAMGQSVELSHLAYRSAASWTISYTGSLAFRRVNSVMHLRDWTSVFFHKIADAACLTAEERLTA